MAPDKLRPKTEKLSNVITSPDEFINQLGIDPKRLRDLLPVVMVTVDENGTPTFVKADSDLGIIVTPRVEAPIMSTHTLTGAGGAGDDIEIKPADMGFAANDIVEILAADIAHNDAAARHLDFGINNGAGGQVYLIRKAAYNTPTTEQPFIPYFVDNGGSIFNTGFYPVIVTTGDYFFIEMDNLADTKVATVNILARKIGTIN